MEDTKTEANQINHEIINNLIPPKNIYASHLKKIQGIAFTSREIDIIACLLRGRRSSKIASLLSIAVRNVENRIAGIKLKLGCGSQEGIIDFIEKSGKLVFMNQYYTSLLIEIAFERELSKLFRSVTQHPVSYLVYDGEQKDNLFMLRELKKHLKLAGLTLWERKENYYTLAQPHKKNEPSASHVICCLSVSLIENNRELFDFFKNNHSVESIIFISLNTAVETDAPTALPNDIQRFDLTKQKNYYLMVFEVLKILLPNLSFEENILNFKKQCITLSDGSFNHLEEEKTLLKNSGKQAVFSDSILKQRKFTSFMNLVVLLFCIGWLYKNVAAEFWQIKSEISTPSNKEIKTWNIPRQDYIFVGRQKLLENLHTKLHNQESFDVRHFNPNSNSNTLAISACSGLGGVGKTQLALYYIRHSQHPYIFKGWFYAENIAQLKQQYIELAKVLGYQEEKPSFDSVLPYIKDWLSKNPGWLLVYDNVTTYKDIKDFLPETGGDIILTTRQRHWPNKFNLLEVNVMTPEEALQLIESITLRKIRTEDQEVVQKLIEKLGYLPLALAQASAYIRNNGIGFKDYLDRYYQAEQKMLADHAIPEGTEHVPVSVTWHTNFDAIKKEAMQQNIPSLSVQLMTVCAYLEPNQIPRALLLSWLKKTVPNQENPEWILDQLLGLLNRYSLITLDPNKQTLEIHRLVQAVLRHQHKQILKELDPYNPSLSQSWYENILNLAHEEFTRKTLAGEDDQRQQALLPHLQSLMSHYTALHLNPNSALLALISFDIGVSLCYKEPALSKDYLEQSLAIFKQKHGSNHLNVSRTLRYLGSIYCLLGDIKKSQALLERALRIDEKIYSNEITSTLNNLGIVYGIFGRVKEQCQLLERVLKMDEQSPDVIPHNIAASLHNLGTAYIASGELIKGQSMLERSLDIYEKEYGPDYFLTSTVLTSLGHANWVLGNLNQAKAQLERSLKIKAQYYHAEHIAIGISLNNLGNIHKDLGDSRKARLCLEKALKISEQHYGKDHLAAAIILNNLYQTIHNINQSQMLFIRAKEIKQAYNIGDISLNFATGYGALGDANHKKLLQTSYSAETQ